MLLGQDQGPTPTISVPKNDTVRTLYAGGKVKELTHELDKCRWDILGLAEVRWTGCGENTAGQATSCGIVEKSLDTNVE